MAVEITKAITLTEDEWELIKCAIKGYAYIVVDALDTNETITLSRMVDRIFIQMPDEVF